MEGSLIQGISGISCLHSILTTEALELEIHITASDSHMDSGASNFCPHAHTENGFSAHPKLLI